ncbi:MAG: hypothetical protein WC894_01035 [Patescibacteria group bacterium]
MLDPTSRDGKYHRTSKKSNCGTIVFIAIIIIAIVACILVIFYLGGIAYVINNWQNIWTSIVAFFAQ